VLNISRGSIEAKIQSPNWHTCAQYSNVTATTAEYCHPVPHVTVDECGECVWSMMRGEGYIIVYSRLLSPKVERVKTFVRAEKRERS